MTLSNFVNTYGGNDLISIDKYCEECTKNEVLTSNWYKEIKGRTIESWQTIGGGIYPVEVCISLLPKKIKGVSQ